MTTNSLHKPIAAATLALAFSIAVPAGAATLKWKGYDWSMTDGGMAGVAQGSSANISIDANGYLHLKIVKNGGTWTASEMFTTQKLGFGTYQWQIEGPVDVFDKQAVLGLFPYGPAAGIGGDGTNEIDIEFSRWGQANGVNADFTDYPNSGNVVGETSFKFSLDGGTSSTARFVWTNSSIESSILKGHQPLVSETGLLKKWLYAPPNPGTNIPQQAMPLGMNLWCFGAPPSDGQNVEIVIRDFQFVKEGDPLPGVGGTNSTGGTSSAGGTSSTGGTHSTGGASSTGGTHSTGGASSTGGSASRGGAAGATNTSGGATGGVASVGTGAGGTGGTHTTGGASSTGGNASSGGAVAATNTSGGATAGGTSAGTRAGDTGGTTRGQPTGGATTSTTSAGSISTGGADTTTGGASNGRAPNLTGTNADGLTENTSPAGCSCKVAAGDSSSVAWGVFVGLTLLARRRTKRRHPPQNYSDRPSTPDA